jgi:two-component system, OmpR family, phosphate regulon sensor histidine kinase PhoR
VSTTRLIGRVLGDRRSVIFVSLVALAATLSVAVFASPNAVGPAMLLPWVALFAFEAGPLLGLLLAATSFVVYTLVASTHDFDVTPTFVAGRFGAFALIAVGVGIAGSQLRRSERRSRRLVEGLPLVMYAETAERLTYISPQIESLLGYSVSEWLAQPGLWRDALHPDDRDRVLAGYREAVETEADFECTYRLVRPDSRAVWVRDSSAFVSDGPRSYRQGFIVDVTPQQQSEEAAERNATFMRALIDGTVDGVTLTDRSGRIVVANRPMLKFAQELGIPPTGLMHDRLLAIAESVDDRQRFERRMRELAATPDVESADEFELDGGERVFQGFTKPVIGSDNAYLGRVWTLRDVTEARQVDRIKDALVATVSHELRTPLTSIVGYLELLGADQPLSAEDARFVEIVRRNAARLQRMVEELLFLSRVEAGGLELDLDDVDVVELARAALGSADPAAAAKRIVLEFDGPAALRARADGNRLGQVFDNLISNAIKFTPERGTVKVSIVGDGETVVASVSDTGCGIPQAEQSRLFERFFRSTATRDLPGTGLGLTIVRAIVEGHGGSIACRSDSGKGTTFTFTIPQRSLVDAAASSAVATAR